MRYSLNPEFDQRLKEAFDELGIEGAAAEAFLELMDRAAIAFSDKVCLRIARNLNVSRAAILKIFYLQVSTDLTFSK